MKQYQMFELIFHGDPPSESHVEIDLAATFTLAGEDTTVAGFYTGGNTYCIRFLPRKSGTCSWKVHSDIPLEGSMTGEEICLDSDKEHHGVVQADGLHFR